MIPVQTEDGHTSTLSYIKCGRAGVFLLVPMLMRVQARVVCAREVGTGG